MGTFHGKESTMTGKQGATWPGDLWKTGGSTAWNGCTYDSDTNLLLCGTGNPSPWNSYNRPGDNLYSASTVAVDADSGEIKWHYQNTPHDGWDYDSMSAIVPFDMNKEGRIVKLPPISTRTASSTCMTGLTATSSRPLPSSPS